MKNNQPSIFLSYFIWMAVGLIRGLAVLYNLRHFFNHLNYTQKTSSFLGIEI